MSNFDFEIIEDLNLDEFFEDTPAPEKEKEEKVQMIQCPCCGETFELKDEYIK